MLLNQEMRAMRFATWKRLVELELVPYSRQHWERLGRAGKAPVRRKLGNRAVWLVDEVLAWQRNFLPADQGSSLD